MSKNLGNIPQQISMTEEQEQTFTNGINKGRKLELERILKLLEIGGPIEAIITDYWGDPEFDKDDALALIEKAIKSEPVGNSDKLGENK